MKLAVFLCVLKWIGIIISVIIALILFVLCIVLFCPIRYKIALSYDENLKLSGNVRFLFPLIFLHFSYEKKPQVIARIFGIPIYRYKDASIDDSKKDAKSKKKKSSINESNDSNEKSSSENTTKTEQAKAKDTLDSKNNDVTSKANTPKAKESMGDKFKNSKEKIQSFYTLITSTELSNAKNLLLKEIIYLLKHLKPQYLDAYITIGFEDPSFTGYCMAFYGILYPVWGNVLRINPIFETDTFIISGYCNAKGKILVFPFIKSLIKLYLSKDIRYILHKIRR